MVTEHDFGKAVIGFGKDWTLVVRNTGCEPLTVEKVVSDRIEFDVVSPSVPFTVAEYGSQDVVVRFMPSGVGEVEAVLIVKSTAQNRDVETGKLVGDVEIEVKGIGIEAVLGDVNGDAETDLLDLVSVIDIILGSVEPTEQQRWAADMDRNGNVNILDALALTNLILTGTAKAAVTPEVMGYLESLRSKLSSYEYARLMEILKGVKATVPTEYTLVQNYPNPFNPVTTIEYTLPEAARVKVEVYNLLGQVVEVLADGHLEAGYHKVQWDGSDMASGIYFYRIIAGNFTDTKRMVLLK